MPTIDAPGNTSEPDEVTAEAGCAACPHPLADHDAIALRFCQASTAGGPTRKCLCSGESAGMTYGNSNKGPINRKATSGR